MNRKSLAESLLKESLPVSRIEIVEVLHEGGSYLLWRAEDSSGEQLDLNQAIGMMERVKLDMHKDSDLTVTAHYPDEEEP